MPPYRREKIRNQIKSDDMIAIIHVCDHDHGRLHYCTKNGRYRRSGVRTFEITLGITTKLTLKNSRANTVSRR